MTTSSLRDAALVLDGMDGTDTSVGYDGLDSEIIERSESTFPKAVARDVDVDVPVDSMRLMRWFEAIDA
jgi:hypothetical protein